MTDASLNEQDTENGLLASIEHPELIFGIVAPIGADSKDIAKQLKTSLLKLGYESTYIKVTELMKEIPTGITLHETPLEARYNSYIDYANKVREMLGKAGKDATGGNDALAMLAIAAIIETRKSLSGKEDKAQHRHAYILDQFKRPEEIALLRKVYGRLFLLVSAHATKKTRLESLKRRIKKSHPDGGVTDYAAEAEELIRRDMSEENVTHGQRLRETFPMADVIINANDKKACELEIDRLVRLFFGHNFITPTHDEYGMYAAKSASLRSADLSRQVGAAIFSSQGEAITLGANEVPKPLGGTYFEGDEPDLRDFAHGADYNEQEKRGIVREFIHRLDNSGCLSDKISKSNEFDTLDKKVEYVIQGEGGPKLKSARVMDLLEFGRQVHAEMNAICDAARLGKSIKDATLFCTTFPCHMCAKLILASGIARVVYIEPYPKSYAEDMYEKSIALESKGPDEKKVLFQPFTGVAPFRYRDLFEKGRRKHAGGHTQDWKDGTARPNVSIVVETYLELEPLVTAQLAKKLVAAGLPPK
jgi:deoxycytidylate deaminase